MTTETPENADTWSQSSTWVPFLISREDMARILRVTAPTISRMLNAGTFPIPCVRLGERVIRFKRPDVEAFFGAPLSVLAPWLSTTKEPA